MLSKMINKSIDISSYEDPQLNISLLQALLPESTPEYHGKLNLSETDSFFVDKLIVDN